MNFSGKKNNYNLNIEFLSLSKFNCCILCKLYILNYQNHILSVTKYANSGSKTGGRMFYQHDDEEILAILQKTGNTEVRRILGQREDIYFF
jgi:hypothetical protein